MPGILYVVATPIGNLEDLSARAIRVLQEVDRIACEDTRQSRKLLDRYGVTTSVVSYHEHNEAARTVELCGLLSAGQSIALISDAGTPLISDPGFRLVRAAIQQGVTVVPVPGPCAAVAALSAAGLPAGRFAFFGFPPSKPAEKSRFYKDIRQFSGTTILYEAPHRILFTLEDIRKELDDCELAAARELTKAHEEILRGTASQVLACLSARPAIKGEFTLVLAPYQPVAKEKEETLAETVDRLEAEGLAPMDALKAAANLHGLSKREAYARMQRLREAQGGKR